MCMCVFVCGGGGGVETACGSLSKKKNDENKPYFEEKGSSLSSLEGLARFIIASTYTCKHYNIKKYLKRSISIQNYCRLSKQTNKE